MASSRVPAPPPYFLPAEALEALPDSSLWQWEEGRGGHRRAILLREPGPRLVLTMAQAGSRLRGHRHLGSESILVLRGILIDGGREVTPGDWVHHPEGSTHAPFVLDGPCVCLVREEGRIQFTGPLQWIRGLKAAS